MSLTRAPLPRHREMKASGFPRPRLPHSSAHWWRAEPPARLLHRLPSLNSVVPQHPPPSLGYRRTGRGPAVGAHRHPLGMNGGCIWLELHHLLLLCAHQPAFSAGLFWWFVGGAVTGQGVGDGKQKKALQSICCRCDASTSRWRIRCLNGEPYRTGRCSGLKDAGESDGISMKELLLSSRKGSSSQSKRGLREASGGLGLRPQSNQGKTPLHRSMHRSRSWERILSNFLFLQEKT